MKYLAQIVLALCFLGAGIYIGKTFFSEEVTRTNEVCQTSESDNLSLSNALKSKDEETNTALSCESKIEDAVSSLKTEISDQKEKMNAQDAEYALLRKQKDAHFKARMALQDKVDYAFGKMREAGIDLPKVVSQEDINRILPSPFNRVVGDAAPSFLNNYAEFIEQETDLTWSSEMQMRITDFFALHELSHKVKLQAVTCKTFSCEFYGFQSDADAHHSVMEDLRNQDWFSSVSTSSMAGDNTVGVEGLDPAFSNYFYILMSNRYN